MSLLTRNSRALSHIVAACAALLIAFVIYTTADTALTRAVANLPIRVSQAGNYLPNLGPNWGAQHVNFTRLSHSLSDGTLVVLGSSELSSHDLRFVPYRFFPKELNVPTLAYGHAMFQSYGIVSVLQSVADSLTPNTRLVIMVSPSWFASGGQLPRSAFAEHVTGPVWDQLWNKPNTREQMEDWITDHANWGLLWLLANGQASELKDKLSLWLHEGFAPRSGISRRADMEVPAHKFVVWPSSAKLSKNDWAEVIDEARNTERKLGSHNPYAVRDDYYKQYLEPLYSPARSEFANIDPMSRTELGDLARVMALLQAHKVRAYFVIQPFNPKLILDVERFDPVAAAINGMCERYDMGCLDLYSIPFERGMLRDDQHLAELGWSMVDQGIGEFFSR